MLRPAPQIAAGSVPVPVEVLAGVALVHAQAAVQVAVDVPEPAREAAAVVLAPVPEAVSIPVRESVIQHVLLRIRRN